MGRPQHEINAEIELHRPEREARVRRMQRTFAVCEDVAKRLMEGTQMTSSGVIAAAGMREAVVKVLIERADQANGNEETVLWNLIAKIRALPLPDWTPDSREPKGCPTPGACSCVEPDPSLKAAWEAVRIRDADINATVKKREATIPAPDPRHWRFRRFVRGEEMAEGITITKATSLHDAIRRAAQLNWEAHGPEMSSLILEPAPDPRDKTIAWLRAELRAALTRCRYDGGHDRELGPIGCSLEATGQSCHCQAAAGIANESEATIARLSAELEAARAPFKCKARPSLPAGPQDCDWPQCGCDPAANRVLAHLQECGFTIVDEATIGVALTEACEALAPFAEAADSLPDKESWEAQNKASGVVVSFYAEDKDDIADWKTGLCVGDLRVARAVLAKLAKGE